MQTSYCVIQRSCPRLLGSASLQILQENFNCTRRMSFSSDAGAVEVEQQATPRRRRRSTTRFTATQDIPSYKEFIHRFTVLSLYRNYLKEIRRMPHNHNDLRDQVQREFKANKTVIDPFNVQRALAEGKRRFEELQGLTGNSKANDGDSWLNTNDEEDPRGRIGSGWPWDR